MYLFSSLSRFRLYAMSIRYTVSLSPGESEECHGPLGSSVAVTMHLQEDVIPARVEVTCFKWHRCYCSSHAPGLPRCATPGAPAWGACASTCAAVQAAAGNTPVQLGTRPYHHKTLQRPTWPCSEASPSALDLPEGAGRADGQQPGRTGDPTPRHYSPSLVSESLPDGGRDPCRYHESPADPDAARPRHRGDAEDYLSAPSAWRSESRRGLTELNNYPLEGERDGEGSRLQLWDALDALLEGRCVHSC